MKRAAMFIAFVAVAALGMFAAVALAGGEGGYPPTTTQTTTTSTTGHTPVTICHKPGTPAQKELTVDDDSVELTGHLGHGDSVGACPGPPTPCPPGTVFDEETETCVPVVVDVCTNLEGNQATIPPGYTLVNGVCVRDPDPVDVCPNIEGNQATVPAGMVKNEAGNCVTPPVVIDVCPNLGGNQTTMPDGYKLENGVCVRVCPDGGPPTPGEGAFDPNDDCKRPPPVTTTTTTTTTPAVTTATTTTPTTTTVAPEVTTSTPETKPPTKVVGKTTPKPDDPGKLTGDKKKDKCKSTSQPGVSVCVTSTGKKVPVYEGQG